MRAEFFGKVLSPIVTKMFDRGMFPGPRCLRFDAKISIREERGFSS